ncbi:MAG: hypothetical protein ABL996_22570 [Micropepsaceae bacterium]
MNVISVMNERPFGRLTAVWILATVVSVAGVVIAPIATFVLMISAFGLPHVLYELRYCDERFSARAPVRALAIIGVLLVVIAAARIGNGAHLIPAEVFVPIELSFGAALAFTAAYFMRVNRVLGAAIGLIFALGATFAPIPTFLIWAWLHNLTPMGFVAEITQGAERRRWLAMLSVPFFVLPALVATGAFHQLGAYVFADTALWTSSIFGAGDKPLMSFLPPGSSDLTLFSAAVVAQSMHYVAVIVLLPQLLAAKQGAAHATTIVPWPSWPVFGAGVAGVAALAFGIYAVSYTDARAAYAVAAAIHSWVEVPILLLALGQGFTIARR